MEPGTYGGIEPIDEDLDRDLGLLRLANELHTPPWNLPKVERRWTNAALVRMEVNRIQAEDQRRKEAAAHRKRRR